MFGEGDEPRKSPERMEIIARRYWIGGFFLLPWLWFVNYWYFKDWMYLRHTPANVRWYIRASLVGCVAYTALFIGWFILFILKRAEWGTTADAISLIIPKGY